MKYRIKIITFKTGRQLFLPQVKKWWGWSGIGYSGRTGIGLQAECETREKAMRSIKKHKSGDAEVKSIKVEKLYSYQIMFVK